MKEWSAFVLYHWEWKIYPCCDCSTDMQSIKLIVILIYFLHRHFSYSFLDEHFPSIPGSKQSSKGEARKTSDAKFAIGPNWHMCLTYSLECPAQLGRLPSEVRALSYVYPFLCPSPCIWKDSLVEFSTSVAQVDQQAKWQLPKHSIPVATCWILQSNFLAFQDQ